MTITGAVVSPPHCIRCKRPDPRGSGGNCGGGSDLPAARMTTCVCYVRRRVHGSHAALPDRRGPGVATARGSGAAAAAGEARTPCRREGRRPLEPSHGRLQAAKYVDNDFADVVAAFEPAISLSIVGKRVDLVRHWPDLAHRHRHEQGFEAGTGTDTDAFDRH